MSFTPRSRSDSMFRWLPARLRLSSPMSSSAESWSSIPWARVLPAKPQIPESRILIWARSISLAARLDRRNPRQIGWQIVCGKGFDVHLDQADKRTAKVRPFPSAAVDDYTDGDNIPTVRAHNIDRFLHPSAACDDVFGHDKPFVRPNLEPPSQHQPARLLLREDMPFPQRASDFLAHNDSTQGGRNHRVAVDLPQ